jgi:hypothetical protein
LRAVYLRLAFSESIKVRSVDDANFHSACCIYCFRWHKSHSILP